MKSVLFFYLSGGFFLAIHSVSGREVSDSSVYTLSVSLRSV